MSRTIKVWVLGRIKMYKWLLPAKRIVCDGCDGTGQHVNPNIDGNGITADEMDELGPEFQENYLSGFYDVPCEECKGQRVIDVVDIDSLTIKMKQRYFDALDEISAADAEAYYERQMGC